MGVALISLNFDNYVQYNSNKTAIQPDRFYQIFSNLKAEYAFCRVNKLYAEERKNLEANRFKIFTIHAGRKRKLLAGKCSDYHSTLLNEVTLKFFYNININMTPEAFDFIRRIPVEEWKEIEALIVSAPQLTPEQINVFKSGNWGHPIFKEKDWPAQALKAFFMGEIDRDRISTLLLYDSCCHNYPGRLQTYQLVGVDGEINSEASQLLEKALDSVIEIKKQDVDNPIKERKRFLTEEERSSLLSALQELRPEDTHFFLYEQPNPFINFFNITKDGITNYRVVIPTNLLNLIFLVKFKKDAVRAKPVLGYSLRDDFAHKTKRDNLHSMPLCHRSQGHTYP